MKQFCVVLTVCMLLLSAVPAFGRQEAALPSVVEGVARNFDFFVKPRALWLYENYFLYDVNRLSRERIGVVLISPFGFEITLVYDVNTLDVLYSDMFLHEKSVREAMRRGSISVADAIKLARIVVKY